jgi:hypothetical protein
MFADLTYLHICDNESDDEESNEYNFENHGLLICVSL